MCTLFLFIVFSGGGTVRTSAVLFYTIVRVCRSCHLYVIFIVPSTNIIASGSANVCAQKVSLSPQLHSLYLSCETTHLFYFYLLVRSVCLKLLVVNVMILVDVVSVFNVDVPLLLCRFSFDFRGRGSAPCRH